MQLIIAKGAAKTLSRIQPKLALALIAELERIATDPFGPHPNAKRLSGGDEYRMRHGDWRAVYRIDREAQQVIVEAIDTRGGVYKG